MKAAYPRFAGAADVREALDAGKVDVAPFGIVPFLSEWERRGKLRAGSWRCPVSPRCRWRSSPGSPTFSRSTISSRPTVLRCRPYPRRRTYLLEMKMEKMFAHYDRVRDQLDVLSHADAMAALVDGSGQIAAYFSSPPFTQLALRDAACTFDTQLVGRDERQILFSRAWAQQRPISTRSRRCLT